MNQGIGIHRKIAARAVGIAQDPPIRLAAFSHKFREFVLSDFARKLGRMAVLETTEKNIETHGVTPMSQ
jgi:hypothetical protein